MKIIAEVGSNWESLDDCRHSIRIAKAVGADAVKFQFYNHYTLYGSGDGLSSESAATPMVGVLPTDWLPHLKETADREQMEFMCTAFSPEGLKIIDPFVKTHKVASSHLTHVRLLEAINQTKKPVYLSTGGSNFSDIKQALTFLPDCQVTLLHCVSAYPTQETNLKRIMSLAKTFNHPTGFSDHSLSIDDIPFQAQLLGASVLEKHFKDKECFSPDNGHSLNPDQFKRMVSYLKGESTDSYLGCENDMALKHNVRLIVTKTVKVGEILEENKNFGIYRSLVSDQKGLSPFLITKVHGTVAKREFSPGDSIGLGEFIG